MAEPRTHFEALSGWCAQRLGSPARTELFRAGHLSTVVGVRLLDDRSVILKVRPYSKRIAGCMAVHSALWKAGFPCAQPLTDAVPFGDGLVISAESMVDDGAALDIAPQHPREPAQALAQLVAAAPNPADVPSLSPPPPWVGWHHEENGIWPLPDDRDADLNAHPGPDWLDDAAARVRARLSRYRAPHVIGHADWEAQNVLWKDSHLHVVHDWDSAVCLPEATVAGAAAAVFSLRGQRFGCATVPMTANFLDAYEQTRNPSWTTNDREAAWAAGLWVLSFNAKKATFDPSDADRIDRLAAEVTERLDRAGAW